MQNLKAMTMGVVASIEFFWSVMANPAIIVNGTAAVSCLYTKRINENRIFDRQHLALVSGCLPGITPASSKVVKCIKGSMLDLSH
jgi:hypothetical protein